MAVSRRPRPGANEGDSPSPFDLDQLRQVVEMMDEHGLTELSLKNGTVQWRLRRGGQEVPMVAYAPPPPPPPVLQQAAPAASPASGPAPTASSSAGDGLRVIKSPAVGTFYATPSPDEPAFVTVGSKVTPTTIVCTIEAMKVFNQIPAGESGVIAEVLVKSGDPVDFNQPLFKLRP